MNIESSKLDTIKHIETVRKYIKIFTDNLTQRGIDHDKTKLETPEVEDFAKVNDRLFNITYASDEYNYSIKHELKDALEHHYSMNRHHPEHFENGINGMNLIDLIEMFADWKASTERQRNGDLRVSIDANQKRFGFDDQLKQIFINTMNMLDEESN